MLRGGGKYIIITSSKVYGFYKSSILYDRAIGGYKHIDDFNYPCIKNLIFDQELKMVEMPLINGCHYYDKQHDEIILHDLLIFFCTSKFIVNEDMSIFMLQHGDVKRDNIIWQSNEKYTFIDLDGLSFMPLLFDFFHYCASINWSLQDILVFLENNVEMLNKIYLRFGKEWTDETLDEALYDYVLFYYNLGAFYGDFKFLTIKNTFKYKKAHALLEKMVK